MSAWLLYFILKLDDVAMALSVIWTIMLTGLILCSLVLFMLYFVNIGEYGNEDYPKVIIKLLKPLKKIIMLTLLLIGVGTFIPSTKQMAVIYFVPKVINNKQIQKMPNKLIELANSWMDEQIKGVKAEVKK